VATHRRSVNKSPPAAARPLDLRRARLLSEDEQMVKDSSAHGRREGAAIIQHHFENTRFRRAGGRTRGLGLFAARSKATAAPHERRELRLICQNSSAATRAAQLRLGAVEAVHVPIYTTARGAEAEVLPRMATAR